MNYIVEEIRKYLSKWGLEKLSNRYYSIYRGIVMNREDPKSLGRLIVKVPQIHGDNVPDNWAWPLFNINDWDIPMKGDVVHVYFENGMPERPIWTYGWAADKSKKVKDADLDKRVISSRSGNRIVLDHKTDKITIETKDGMKITIDDQIKFGNGQYSLVQGELLRAQLEINTARIDAIINAIENGTPVAQDGGAGYQASMKLILSAIQNKENYSQILSNKVKTQ